MKEEYHRVYCPCDPRGLTMMERGSAGDYICPVCNDIVELVIQ